LYPEIFEHVLDGYKEIYPNAKFVLERFEAVKKRGRNKKKWIFLSVYFVNNNKKK